MLEHRLKTIIKNDGKLILENLPFYSGESVEVIIVSKSRKESEQNNYPLRGTAIRYIEPTEPVAWDDWNVTQ